MHSPSGPAGPAATVIGLPFRSMSATVTHHTTSGGRSPKAAISVVLAKTTVVTVVFTLTGLGLVAAWPFAGNG